MKGQSEQAFPRQLGSSDDAFIALIQAVNSRFPRFVDSFVDGGAGIGSVVDRVLAGAPGCRVIAYEPLPENVKILAQRFGDTPLVEIRQAAIGDKSATVEFEVPTASRNGTENTPWVPGTSGEGAVRRPGAMKSIKRFVKKVIRWDARPPIPVKMVRLDSDLSAAPDVVKFDLGGGEPQAFQGLEGYLPKTKIVKFELGLFGSDHKARRRSVDILRNAGFFLFVEDLLFSLPEMTDSFRAKLTGVGIEILREYRMHGPSDPTLFVAGKWTGDQPLPIEDMRLTREFADMLKAERANFFQVDVVALNSRYAEQWKSVMPVELLKLAGMSSV